MTTDDERPTRVRQQERTSRPPRPTSASITNLPFSNVFLAAVTAKEKLSNYERARPSTASSAGPPVPPRHPARSRRPATSGSRVTPQPREPSPTTAFSMTTGPLMAVYSPEPPKVPRKTLKAEPSSGRPESAQLPSATSRQRRSSHDLRRPPHNSAPWTSSPATPATPSTSSKRRPTTSSGVITPKQTNFTEGEKRGLKGLKAALRATTMPRPYFVTKNGKRHHNFSSERAPYPRNYEHESLDQCVLPVTDLRASPKELIIRLGSDDWNHLFFTQLCDSPTFHQFTQPPKRVLDLGCGHGLWVRLLPLV
jgi:hypothetical protein